MKPHPFQLHLRYFWYIVLLMPVLIFRDYTPANELKYISIALESLQNNTWFTFYNHGEIYADKPPLFLWLIKISYYLTNNFAMYIMGLFSLLPAIGVIAIMDKWVKSENIILNPLVSNGMLLTTVMFLVSALEVRMDMLMLFFIVLSLYTFYRIYKKQNRPIEKYLLPVYIFLALFTKGPVGLFAPVGSIVIFLLIKKEIRTIGHYLGWREWLIIAGLCTIWFIGVYIEGGVAYLDDLVFRQTVGRGFNSFHHKGPVWYYFPRMLWSFAPWSILLIIVYAKSIYRKYFKTDLQKFFLVIIAFNLILLSLISSKLDIYLLPIYPFVIYLGCILLEEKLKDNKVVRISLYIPAVLLAVVSLTALIFNNKILSFLTDITYSLGWIPYLAVLVLLCGSIIVIIMLVRKNTNNAIISLSASLICTMIIGAFSLPQMNQYIGYKDIAELATDYKKYNATLHYSSYKSKSLQNIDVYLNDSISRINTPAEIDSLNQLKFTTIIFVANKDISKNEELEKCLSKYPCGRNNSGYSWYLINYK